MLHGAQKSRCDAEQGTTHLYEASDRLAICGHDVLLICVHYAVALCPAQVVLGQVQIDLIAIKVGVEGRAICIVHADDALTLHHMAKLDIKQNSKMSKVLTWEGSNSVAEVLVVNILMGIPACTVIEVCMGPLNLRRGAGLQGP